MKKDFSVLGKTLLKVHDAWLHEKKIYTAIKYNFSFAKERLEVKMAVSVTIKMDGVISPHNVH